jgi:hypothetical protein
MAPTRAPLLSAALAALCLALGCPSADDDTADDDTIDDDDDSAGDDDDTPLGIAQREDGWLRGDLHLHTSHSDGYNDVATVVALGEYLEDEVFQAYHPEYAGNHLDFIALTDHRTTTQNQDPGFTSDRLILLPGEEFGGDGHAGCWGVSDTVQHDPDGDGTTTDDVAAAVAETHAQGALFSPNHPVLDTHLFRWDVRDLDAIEIWNFGWALASPAGLEEDIASWEATHGPASPFIKRAVREQGVLADTQGLTLWEAMLARGIQVALVGGSDRHALVLPGTPATYVRAEGADVDAVLDGIRARHTFVSRNPAAAQLLMEVELDGATHELGDSVPVAAGGATATIRVRVARASGGLLRIVAGSAVASDEALEDAELGLVVHEQAVDGNDMTVEVELAVVPGDWVYPMVFESLVPAGATTAQADLIYELAETFRAGGAEPSEIATTLAPLLTNLDALGDPTLCDPADWEPDGLQCVPVEGEGMGSVFIPDLLDRALHAHVEADQVTDWCMGALGTAVLFTEDE